MEEFSRFVAERCVTGATSNPPIFAKAITSSDRYDEQIRRLAAGEHDRFEVFLALALEDVRRAPDVLGEVFDQSAGADGFVSFERTPDFGRRHRGYRASSPRSVGSPRPAQT
ncbi:MAG: hypothetical protein HYX32_05920 [Actinobacteria bacterium]|nr:hypothetical protein [Actinomycetota bacterium]